METTIDYFGRNWDDSTRLRYVFEQCFDREKLLSLPAYGRQKLSISTVLSTLLLDSTMLEKAHSLGFQNVSRLNSALDSIFKSWKTILSPQIISLYNVYYNADLLHTTKSVKNSRIQFLFDIFNLVQFDNLFTNYTTYRLAALQSQDEQLLLLLGYIGYLKIINVPHIYRGSRVLWLDTIPKLLANDSTALQGDSTLAHIPSTYLINYNSTTGYSLTVHLRKCAKVKKCSRCGTLKPITDYGSDKSCITGLSTYCKACSAIRKLEREKHIINADYSKEWNDSVDRVYSMRKDGQHVDHIIPLRGKLVSGLHIGSNLQLLSAEANIRKSNKHDPLTYRHILPDGTDVFGR